MIEIQNFVKISIDVKYFEKFSIKKYNFDFR